MQRLDVSGAVRPLYGSLGVKGLMMFFHVRTGRCLRGFHITIPRALIFSLILVTYIVVFVLNNGLCMYKSRSCSLCKFCLKLLPYIKSCFINRFWLKAE